MSLLVRICSLNAHDNLDEKADFNTWICPDSQPDILVIGIQELTHKVKDIALNSTNLNNVVKKWLLKTTFTNNIKEKYETLKWNRIGSLLLIVYIKKSLSENVSDVILGSLAIGALGMANKGCVAIAFKFNKFQFCFINAHLVAGRANNLKRLDHFQTIMDFLKFSPIDEKDLKQTITISDMNSDALFLFGDLNFRLQNISKAMTKKFIDSGIKPQELLKFDEFYLNRKTEPYYSFFKEGPIEFMPSYKFVKGKNVYNLIEKGHISYTDRILWQGLKDIKNISYEMHQYISFSDHRPISGNFEISLRRTTSDDQEENEISEGLILTTKLLDFGCVKFLEPKKITVSIKNLNKHSIQINISKVKSEIKLPTWLTIFPNNFLIESKQSLNISFQINIHKEEVFPFNLGNKVICGEKIEIFSDQNDVIPLNIIGKYRPTLLGLPLEVIEALKQPVSQLSCEYLKLVYQNITNKPSTDTLDQPSFGLALIYRLLSILKQKSTRISLNEVKTIQENLRDSINLREFLDTGYMKPFIKVDFHSAFNMVFLFLEMLPTPLIPQRFISRCLSVKNDPKLVVKIIDSMPTLYNKVFRRVLINITQFDSHLDENIMMVEEIEYLSACLEKVIFRSQTLNEHHIGCQLFKLILSSKVDKTNKNGNLFLNTLYRHNRIVTVQSPLLLSPSQRSERVASSRRQLEKTELKTDPDASLQENSTFEDLP